MSENQNHSGMNLGELSTIRNILMGQQMAEYAQTFQAMNGRMDKSEAAFNEKLKDFEERVNTRFTTLEQDINNRFDRLEKLLLENANQLHTKIDNVSTTDKADLGKMLAEVSKRLMGTAE